MPPTNAGAGPPSNARLLWADRRLTEPSRDPQQKSLGSRVCLDVLADDVAPRIDTRRAGHDRTGNIDRRERAAAGVPSQPLRRNRSPAAIIVASMIATNTRSGTASAMRFPVSEPTIMIGPSAMPARVAGADSVAVCR
jgi:hypothetical protein